jgi:hypothetical protein
MNRPENFPAALLLKLIITSQEMSTYTTQAEGRVRNHPLKAFFRRGSSVQFCTDKSEPVLINFRAPEGKEMIAHYKK